MSLSRRSFMIGAFALLYVSGCSSTAGDKATSATSSNQKELDTSKLRMLIDQLEKDLDEYEMDSDVLAYSNRVSEAMGLLTDSSATQSEIDKAAEEIEALREVVIDKNDPSNAASLVGVDYESFVNDAQNNIGNTYHVEGSVTDVNGGFRGADYQVYVWWDETMTFGEVSCVYISYENYKHSVNRYFSGACVLRGLDDRGHPFFSCDTKYTAE